MFSSTIGTNGRQQCVFTVIIVLMILSLSESSSKWDCNFETDFCNWDPAVISPWQRSLDSRWKTEDDPYYNSTHGSGTYAYYNASGAAILAAKNKIPANQVFCLSFSLIQSGPIPQLLQVTTSTGGVLLNRTNKQDDRWHRITVEIPSSGKECGISFLASQSNSKSCNVFLDDIQVIAGSCAKQAGPACTFESGLCGWNSASSNEKSQITMGSGRQNSGIGLDHTLQIKNGHYLIANDKDQKEGQVMSIRSVTLLQSSPVCIRFFYYLQNAIGNNILTLASKGPIDRKPDVLWVNRDTRNGIWKRGEVTLYNPFHSQITFSVTVGENKTGAIGIDDITITNQACPVPGTYGFEHGLDLFYNDPDNEFNWVVARNIDEHYEWLPKTDRTTSSKYGHFAVASLAKDGIFQSRATLWSPIFPPTAGVCMTMYLYFTGTDPGSLSIDLMPYGEAAESVINVWFYRPKLNETYYKPILFPVRYADYYQLRFMVTLGSDGAWAFDNLQTMPFSSKCTIRPLEAIGHTFDPKMYELPPTKPPAICGPHDCDFDTDLCGWTSEPSVDFKWVRSGSDKGKDGLTPAKDHTPGTKPGEYIHLGPDQIIGTTALLRSPIVTHDNDYEDCFSFWYVLSGDHTGGLDVYVHPSPSGNELRFQRNWPTNGWRQVQIRIRDENNYQINIQGTRGQTNASDISIDDVRLTNGSCTDDTAYDCSFEEMDLCGFTGIPVVNEIYAWQWSQTTDHTYGVPNGHALAIVTDHAEPGFTGTVVSKTLKPMSGCLTVWWKSDAAWFLKLFTKIGPTQVLLIRKNVIKTSDWSLIEVPIATNQQFTLIIQGEMQEKHIAGNLYIDDLKIATGSCETRGSCSFEMICAWSNDPKEDFAWKQEQGSFSDFTNGPAIDFTYGVPEGHYLMLDYRYPRVAGKKARFNSETFTQGTMQCFEFMFSMNGTNIGSLNVYVVQVPSGKKDLVWSVSDGQNVTWQRATVSVMSDISSYFIQIEGVLGTSTEHAMAIDDLMFFPSNCSASPLESQNYVNSVVTTPSSTKAVSTTSAASKTTAHPPVPYFYDCDFEDPHKPTCLWTSDETALGEWVRKKASKILPQLIDHTLQSGKGHVLTQQTYNSYRVARLLSPTITKGGYCLTMWVRGDYTHDGKLEVVKQIGPLQVPIFVTETATIRWKKLWINVATNNDFRIIISSTKSLHSPGGVYLDDIKIYKGQCPQVHVEDGHLCDFEDGNTKCGYTASKIKAFHWLVSNFETNLNDHTTRTEDGHFLYAKQSEGSKGDKAIVKSPTYASTGSTGSCLVFYYHLHGTNIGQLNVYVTKEDGTTAKAASSTPQWSKTYDVGSTWTKAFVQIPANTKYSITFEAVRGATGTALYAIDDVDRVKGPCPDANKCTFEDGMCLWTSDGDATVRTNTRWTLYQTSRGLAKYAPEVDKTTGTQSGHYLLIDAQGMTEDNARLYSQVFPYSTKSHTISFWFAISNANIGSLQIRLLGDISGRSAASERLLWQTFDSTKNKWTFESIYIPHEYTLSTYKIVIAVITSGGSPGSIAIDDIDFTTNLPTSPASPATNTAPSFYSTTSTAPSIHSKPSTAPSIHLTTSTAPSIHSKPSTAPSIHSTVRTPPIRPPTKTKTTPAKITLVKTTPASKLSASTSKDNLGTKPPPPATAAASTTSSGDQTKDKIKSDSNDSPKWPIPVGVSCGVVVIAGIVAGIVILRRRASPRNNYNSVELDNTRVNPIYGDASTLGDIQSQPLSGGAFENPLFPATSYANSSYQTKPDSSEYGYPPSIKESGYSIA